MQAKHALIALAFIGVSASVYAQTAAPPSPAAVLLKERKSLQLSSAQVKQLEALDRKYTHEARPVEERMMKTRASERRLRAKEKTLTPAERETLSRDRAAMRKDAEEISSFRRTNRAEAMKVLTPTQRTKAEQMMKERAAKHPSTKKPAKKSTQHPMGRPSGSRLQLLPH
jgi:hypothetical protein